MKIAVVASEAVPFSKTGGLADVAGTLFKEYVAMGLEAYLFVPLYKKTWEQCGEEIHDMGFSIEVHVGRALRECRVFTLKGPFAGRVFFISSDEYFGRDELYGTPRGDYPDNDQRFIFFSRGVLEVCKRLDLGVDIMHCNDWQTGLIPLYMKTIYGDVPVLRGAVSVLTIHNLGYQGLFPPQSVETAGLGWGVFNPEGVEFYGRMNFLKAGIVWADVITTVSETYAKEILTPEFGFGLDGVLRKRAASLFGILNGIDYEEWNPSADRFITGRYGESDLKGKAACKEELMERCALEGDASSPLVCFVGRLSAQKGVDIIGDAIPGLIAYGARLAVIGRGDEPYHRMLNSAKDRFPRRVFFHDGFDEALAHLVYAGSDIFLMPSRYEPCGLGQMIAMHYGTLPVARRTGGISDTVEDGGTGFLFDEYSPASLARSVGRALDAYANKRSWQKMMRDAMGRDFSWAASARKYLKVYNDAVGAGRLVRA